MKHNPINKSTSLNSDSSYISVSSPEDFGSIAASVESYKRSGEEFSHANHYSLKNLLPNISSKSPFTRDDYEYFRPNEAIPKNYKDIIKACDAIYVYNGLIRHVIDLMSDFACQGICFSHPVKTIQKFYEDWALKVQMKERSERFLSCFYRHNMVTIDITNAKLPSGFSFAKYYNTEKNYDFTLPPETIKLTKEQIIKRLIPIKYTFLHPSYVDPKKYIYGPPADNFGFEQNKVQLNKDNTRIYFYKKDDWMIKPIPFLFPLIQHAIMIDKLNLADSAALDGATSRLRIIKLGNADVTPARFPGPAQVAKLDEILRANVGGGQADIIWGPDIELLESKTDLSSFLGPEKFGPHIEQLYVGLGVPPTLVGSGGGTTNNLMALKTFIQRLIYGREQLTHFWQEQNIKIQKAMGFARPATIEYDFMDLGEEAAHRKLLLDMVDRNIISEERLLKLLDHDPDMEKIRVNREERERRSDRRAYKTSPWHDPQFGISLQKIALQKGYITPEQAGIEIPEEYEGDKTPFDMQMDMMAQKATQSAAKIPANKKSGVPGRPIGAKDGEKRKQKTFNPRIKAAKEIWATSAYNKISEFVKPLFFEALNKNNLRQLTTAELLSFEEIKFNILCQLDLFGEVTKEFIAKNVLTPNGENYKEYKQLCSSVKKEVGRELSLDELRQIQIFIYTNDVV